MKSILPTTSGTRPASTDIVPGIEPVVSSDSVERLNAASYIRASMRSESECVAALKHHVVRRDAHSGIGLQAMDRVVGQRVRTMRTEQRRHRCLHVVDSSGRKLAEQISERRVDIGFVEGDPVGAQITELGDHAFAEKAEMLRAFVRGESRPCTRTTWDG